MSPIPESRPPLLPQLLQVPVIVAALGYLVDMYDLFLFSVVRVPSLKALNVPTDQLLTEGIRLLNYQMAGMLIGGVLWGVIGDKKGRLSVLFGSIIMYSIANIGNGFVQSLDQYALLRFVAGVGLAGELGAGITLVTEVLPKEIRGYGTTLVATLGVMGAILAYFVADLFAWRISYFVGGGMGLLLLVLRFNVFESGMFKQVKENTVDRGNIMMILTNGKRLGKYLMAILVGLPIWFVVGILITFSPEFGAAKGIEGINAGKAVMIAFSGQVGGDIVSGLLSQYLKSRKKVIRLFIILSLAMVIGYLMIPMQDLFSFYLLCALLGFCNGYWTLFITIAAELFGTNLRATVATTVPNFVRGATIPLAALFVSFKPGLGVIQSALVIGVATSVIALFALYFLEETFTKDMNFVEEE
ncbi:MFS transporter [Dyadobacter arcticus]|uniref:MFS family arabinose efflux permease n=1 Tax=Dyadobacter arcticus TaxID=1078754 RepID=A0ABX0UFF7_9BACT|nr:MFS transporter [Dyadobacter arcticus]NIJ51716.1 putative MFS family arabinose efflux permease [Dyadobacter arcticus]